MKKVPYIVTLLMLCINFSFAQEKISGPYVQLPVYFDISPPLRDMVKDLPVKAETSWKDGIVRNKFNINQNQSDVSTSWIPDPNLQSTNGTIQSDAPIANFEGNSNTTGVTPPDTHGDVGPNHYFQVVNCHYSIYNKTTGAVMLGPLNNSSIFTGMSNNSNDGDACVLYDEQADRWLFSQFSLPSYPNGPFYQMIAVSQTGDPTGAWYRYQYSFTDMPDYPKFGVWGDGYYMSMHRFASGSGSFLGTGAVAYNRSLMLAGSPAATMILFTQSGSSVWGWLPSDCDGAFPTGNPPNYFLYFSGSSALGIYQFTSNWTTPASSTLTSAGTLSVNSFTHNMSGVSQSGTTVKLDMLNDRMMYRLQYRTFADYSAMVCCHTVDATSTVAGVRWYELRKTTGSWSIYQQGTYQPDNNSRWMGSIAMDAAGNIALGYSVSSSSMFPAIRYTGRKKSDALNSMTIAESEIIAGGGSSTDASNHRWGDYSAMSCDPSAASTFWYTQEYFATTSATSWRTRIASFKIATPPDVTSQAASAITSTGATLNGSVNPNGVATNYNFNWGTTTSYGTTTSNTSAGSGSTAVAASANITGLSVGTTYHYRVTATSTDGTSLGSDMTFTPGVAIVTTTAITAIGMNSATSGGNVTADGGLGVTARGVCWATTANPTTASPHTSDGTGTGVYPSSITGLLPNTLYHVRAFATNSYGTQYGTDLTFTTACTNVTTYPWTEGFENGGLITNCWAQSQIASSGLDWAFATGNGGTGYPAAAYAGTYNALLKDFSSGDNKTMLVTPGLNLTSVSGPQLKFWHTQIAWTGRQDVLEIYYKTSAGGTWTLLTSYTSEVATWTQETITLPNPSSDYYIAFQGNAKYGRGICIDNVEVSAGCASTYPVSVAITPSANPVCSGASVTFTATPTNGGTTPAYQWKVNTVNAGTNNASFTYTPSSGDQVTCVLTSNASCVTGSPATSNAVTMSFAAPVAVSVAAVASANPFCVGSSVTFTATPTNGGTTPAYQWKVNDAIESGATNSTLTYSPQDGDVFICVLTSNAGCVTGNPASSSPISMTEMSKVPVGITISASANPVIEGTSVTFTATPYNGGSSPVYQWHVGGVDMGINSASFNYVPANNDVVTCTLTSNEYCVSSNPANSTPIVMVVNSAVPSTLELQNIDVTGNKCYNADQTISVAGNGTSFDVKPGGTTELIAGVSIIFYPGTLVEPGGYLYGHILPGGPWCPQAENPEITGVQPTLPDKGQSFYRIYPNPTTGMFALELNATDAAERWLVEIYDMKGRRVMSDASAEGGKHDYSLSGKPAGIYLVRIVSERNSGTARIVKQ